MQSNLQVTLSNCNTKNYNNLASWPTASAEYYKNSNITANSDWYFNQQPCVGWVFNTKKGLCPLGAAQIKVTSNEKSEKEYYTYSEFMKENPYELAPKCDTSSSSKRRRLKSKPDGLTYTLSLKKCIDLHDSNEADDVFKTMTTINKENKVTVDTTMTDNWAQYRSLSKYAPNAAIISWVFFPFFIINLTNIIDGYGGGPIGLKLSYILLLAAFMILGIVSNLYSAFYSSNLFKTTSEQWSPMFPGCEVKVSFISTGIVVAVIVMMIFICICQVFELYQNRRKFMIDDERIRLGREATATRDVSTAKINENRNNYSDSDSGVSNFF